MHNSAMLRMKWFVDNYIVPIKKSSIKVLDIGSYDVNGSYKDLFKYINNVEYTGLDATKGPNVDIVPADPYKWKEIKNNTYDFIISGNAFEHIEYPWLTIKEISRVLKPGGIVCILVPFYIREHKYPVDCYRYYSDGLIALAKWAELDVIQASVGGFPCRNETYMAKWMNENYDDSVLIAGKSLSKEVIDSSPKFNYIKQIHEIK